ncbi:hypothetical protein [Streptomyces capitiformicae]|nr:hypothetical protein [Streptomyces capitiformicae]
MERLPYQSVRVNFANSDYRNVCEDFGGGFDAWPAWEALGNFLAHRPGWHFDVVKHGEPLWSLGLLGESRLNVSVEDDGSYHCYDADRDDDVTLSSVGDVESWVEPREDEARKPSRVLLGMARSDDWRILKAHLFQLYVSWSDGYFAATLPALTETGFGRTLAEAVNHAGQMLCHLFGAPIELAPQLTMLLELDVAATRRLGFVT